MTEQEFINKAITSFEIEKGRYSCLSYAISDARKITGRDLLTGIEKNDVMSNDQNFIDTYSFIGIINYLLILDLIGTAFKLHSYSTLKTNAIFNCLKQFSSLKEIEIDVIISLRNSLAHNYSLLNIPYNSKEYGTKLHHFKLLNGHEKEIIVIKDKWDGNKHTKSDINETIISVGNLLNMIEGVIFTLKEHSKNNDVILNVSFEEFKMKFTVIH